MLKAKQLFETGITRVQNIDSLFVHLTTQLGFNSTDVSDLLRSEIVYSLSSFDRLIHDLVKDGMVESFKGNRTQTNSYKNFSISLNQFDAINSASIPPAEFVFAQTITLSHKHLSFQDPDKITEALSLIWLENHKWQKIALEMGMNQNDLRTELKNIVIRRNQIVHEGDFDLFLGKIQPISHADTQQAVNFLNKLGNSIYDLVK